MTLPGAVGTITTAVAGANFSLALTSSGQLFAWGENCRGQLGIPPGAGSSCKNTNFTLVTLPGAIGTITQIAAGEAYSLAVTSSGQLYAFGGNYYGQLGTTANNGTKTPNPSPTLVTLPGLIGAITQVAGSGNDTLVVSSSGQLYAFGNNTFGQLGLPANEVANPTPALLTLPWALDRRGSRAEQ